MTVTRNWYRSWDFVLSTGTPDFVLPAGYVHSPAELDPSEVDVNILLTDPAGAVISSPSTDVVAAFRATDTDVTEFDVRVRIFREARGPEHIHFGFVAGTLYLEFSTVVAAGSPSLRIPAMSFAPGWSTMEIHATARADVLRRGVGVSVFPIRSSLATVTGILLPDPLSGRGVLTTRAPRRRLLTAASPALRLPPPSSVAGASPAIMLDPL